MKYIRLLARGQRGFTLVELVVVIAILGTLAAISVPMVTQYLAQGKTRAYNADVARIQEAVEAYYSAPDNVRFLGAPQFPVYGADRTATGTLLDDATNASTDLASPKNPLGGTVGGAPSWTDDGDGIRNEDLLNGPAGGAAKGWHTATAVRQAKTYYVDSRDFIIDMTKLTAKKLLDGIPNSASADNAPSGTTPAPTGAYIYYVDSTGKVKTLLSTFPVSTNAGFKDVYP